MAWGSHSEKEMIIGKVILEISRKNYVHNNYETDYSTTTSHLYCPIITSCISTHIQYIVVVLFCRTLWGQPWNITLVWIWELQHSLLLLRKYSRLTMKLVLLLHKSFITYHLIRPFCIYLNYITPFPKHVDVLLLLLLHILFMIFST